MFTLALQISLTGGLIACISGIAIKAIGKFPTYPIAAILLFGFFGGAIAFFGGLFWLIWA